MKNFFKNPYNILFAAAGVFFLQFLAAVVCFFSEAVIYFSFTGASSYVYMAYCAAVCVFSALFIIKKRAGADAAGIWFAGFFSYAFFEIIFFLKVQLMTLTGYSLLSDAAFSLWDNQPLYRLHICAGAVFLIYTAMYIYDNNPKSKKIYAGFAGANLLIFGLAVLFMPEAEALLIDTNAGIFEVALIGAAREAGVLIFMLNSFIFALYKFYQEPYK